MYHSRRKTQDSPLSFSHSNHHGPVVDFVQVVCRLKFGLYLLPENWAPVEGKNQKRIRTIDVLITLAFNLLIWARLPAAVQENEPAHILQKERLEEHDLLYGFQPIR